MREQNELVEALAADWTDAAADGLCGTPCREVVDSGGFRVCMIKWEDGCPDDEPPAGFEKTSLVGDLCRRTCAFYHYAQQKQREQQQTSSE